MLVPLGFNLSKGLGRITVSPPSPAAVADAERWAQRELPGSPGEELGCEELGAVLIPVTSYTPNTISPGWRGMSMGVPAGSEHRQSHQHRRQSSPLRFKHLSKRKGVRSRQGH